MKYNFKVGDLVTWVPDGDVGIVTKVDKFVLEEEADNLAPEKMREYEPFWVCWVQDPGASGWHGRDHMLKLLNPA